MRVGSQANGCRVERATSRRARILVLLAGATTSLVANKEVNE